jgi:uncharacterized membrane protein YphA (DoxX/SURF4 family)
MVPVRILAPLVGVGMAVAGWEKLADERGYRRLFRHFGWSHADLWRVGVAELAGGALMVPPATRRIGGAIMAAASVPQLAAEIRHRDHGLTAARVCVLAVALAAVLRR